MVLFLELQRKLGETKADQERRLQERLKRRQDLIKEREEKGLSCEEAIIDAIQDQEEEEQKKEELKNRKVRFNLFKYARFRASFGYEMRSVRCSPIQYF